MWKSKAVNAKGTKKYDILVYQTFNTIGSYLISAKQPFFGVIVAVLNNNVSFSSVFGDGEKVYLESIVARTNGITSLA